MPGDLNNLRENEAICEECHHLFNTVTLEVVKGWERVYWVSVPRRQVDTPDICHGCREAVIDGFQKAVPA